MKPERRTYNRSPRDPLLNKWLIGVLIIAAGLIGCVLYFQKNKNEKLTASAEQPKTVEKQQAGTGRVKTEKERTIPEHGITFTYELEEPGQVSAGVYNHHGVLVRTLLRAQPQDPGKHILHWDGLDRLGKPQPPGKYTIKLLRKPPFKKEFIMQVGVNPSSKPYHRWVGDFGGGTSVAVDDSGMYISSRNAEGNFMLLKQSVDGTERMWERGDVDPWRGGLSLATDGKTVYVLQQNAFITLFDAATGQHNGRWDVLPKNHKDRNLKGRKRRKVKYTDHKPIAALDLAVRGAHRVLTDEKANAIKWLAEDGSVASRAEVDSPRGVAISPNGTVYAISGDKVLSVTRQGKTRTVVHDLKNPWRLTFDTTNDDLLVVEGRDEWRVKRFDLTGALKQTCGRKGGRLQGPYNPRDFRGVKDITSDGKGGFFVAEPQIAPRRIAHLNIEGKLIREWYGGLTFFAPRSIDPRDPTQVWYRTGGGWVLANVDYENQTWSVLETHRFGDKAGGLGRDLGNRRRFVVRYHKGKRYLIGESFPPMVFRHRNGHLVPLVMGNRRHKFPQHKTVARLMTQSDNPETIKTWIRKHLGKKRRKKNTYFWTDGNGDHEPQPDEITLRKLGNVYHGPGIGAYIANDFSVICRGGDYNPRRGEEGETKFYTSIARLAPTGWSGGVPQYNLPERAAELDVAPIYVEPQTDAYIGRAGVRHTFQGRSGAFYAFYHWGDRGFGGFPNYQAGRYARLTKWSTDGQREWSVGRKASGANKAAIYWKPTRPGSIHYPTLIAGEVRGTVVVCDRIVNPGMAWTKDGLFAGAFFPGRIDDGLPGWVYVWQRDMETNTHSLVNHDSLEGGAVTEYKNKVYYYSPGCNSLVLYQIHGYDRDEWRRIRGNVRIDKIMPHAQQKGTGLRAEIYSGTDVSGPPDATIAAVPPENLKIPSSVETAEGVAMRLTGMIETPLSEKFKITVGSGGVRLWINGRQVLERWNEDQRYGAGGTTKPIALRAGERVPIQIDFYTSNPDRLQNADKRSIPLRWESKNTDPHYIPARFLYPAELKAIGKVEPRPATEQIHARSHDHTISSDAENLYFDNFHCRHHIRGLENGKYLGYRKIDFGEGVDKFIINLRKGNAAPVKIELRLVAPDGPVMETITLPEIGFDYRKDKSLTFDLNAPQIRGVHDLYLIAAAGRHGPRMRWFSFE
ncbi:MAG: PA14 domain-containing protein [Candidatus Brocadiia bacterium]